MKVKVKAMGGIESEVGFNEREIAINNNATISTLLSELNAAPDLAVTLNDVMVYRTKYAMTELNGGDSILLLPPIAAG